MHYKLCFLHVAHACPYDRQSHHTISTVTATSYIQVTEHSDLCMESTSPYEGHTHHPSSSQLLHPTSGLLWHISGLPKILHWLCLTLLTMLALWEHHTNNLDKVAHLDLHLPTIQGIHMYICCWFTTSRWGVTHFYQKLKLCSCGT